MREPCWSTERERVPFPQPGWDSRPAPLVPGLPWAEVTDLSPEWGWGRRRDPFWEHGARGGISQQGFSHPLPPPGLSLHTFPHPLLLSPSPKVELWVLGCGCFVVVFPSICHPTSSGPRGAQVLLVTTRCRCPPGALPGPVPPLPRPSPVHCVSASCPNYEVYSSSAGLRLPVLRPSPRV